MITKYTVRESIVCASSQSVCVCVCVRNQQKDSIKAQLWASRDNYNPYTCIAFFILNIASIRDNARKKKECSVHPRPRSFHCFL
jgi:hypothetical protein